jgi:uncharacterized protein (TIGR00251 family)
MATCTLELKVIPNAPRDEIAGWLGDALKVKIKAPALEGRANEALLDFLATQLGVPRRDLTLVRGDKSRRKVVQIAGLASAGRRLSLAARPGDRPAHSRTERVVSPIRPCRGTDLRRLHAGTG